VIANVFFLILGGALLVLVCVLVAAPFIGKKIHEKFYQNKNEKALHNPVGRGDPPKL